MTETVEWYQWKFPRLKAEHSDLKFEYRECCRGSGFKALQEITKEMKKLTVKPDCNNCAMIWDAANFKKKPLEDTQKPPKQCTAEEE